MFKHILILTIILLILSQLTESSLIKREYLTRKYEKYQQLGPNYEIFWRLRDRGNEKKDVIHIALHVATSGWVGFGIPEKLTGSMGSSDVLVGYVVNGAAVIEDRYAIGFSMPLLDECQDVTLIAGEEEVYNGTTYTTIEFKRKLINKKDKIQDRPIRAGDIQVIWAYGMTDTFGYHGPVNRKPATVRFIEVEDIDLEADGIMHIDFRMPNYSGPSDQKTHYACSNFLLPFESGNVYDIIAIAPLPDPFNPIGIHHYNFMVCNERDEWFDARIYPNASNCFVPTQPLCSNSIYAAGSANPRTLYLPDEAGFRIGIGYYQYFSSQIHYNNPNFVSWTDNTGIRIYYTADLKEYRASGVILANVEVRGDDLPPGIARIDRQYDCTSECTNTFSDRLTIFGAFLHSHQTCIQISAFIRRTHPVTGAIKNITIVNNEFFVFDWQYVGAIDRVLIKPGDEIIVHCIYDTRGRTEPTPMGISSDEEMCNVILWYYMEETNDPDVFMCGWFFENNVTSTTCKTKENHIIQPNPKSQDPLSFSDRKWGNVTDSPYCEESQQQRNNFLDPEAEDEDLPSHNHH